MRRRIVLALAALTGLVATLGCNPRSAPGQQPSWRETGAEQGDSDPGAVRTEVVILAPEGPGAVAYNAPSAAAVPSFPLSDALLAAIADASAAAGKSEPRPDPRLYAAARELAAVAPQDAPLTYRLVEFALHRNGIVEPSPHLMVIWGPADDPPAILEQLAGRLGELVGGGDFSRVGIGTASRGEAGDVTVLALQQSFLSTEPIPRTLPLGGVARLAGKVRSPFSDPQVFVTRGDGSVVQPPVATEGATGFRAQVRCDERGRQQIEITAVDASGSTVLANFPVWCGDEPPRSVQVDLVAEDRAPPSSSHEAEARMIELVNRDRAAHGLAPLAVDERLAAVARAHSQEMFDTGIVAHVSERTGTASDRVRAGGIKTAVVLENVARAYGVIEAQEGLMNSPGHRANLLAKEVTHLGVGIVLGDEVAGQRELFVTQVFSRVPGRIDAAAVAAEVAAKLTASRPLAEDPVLTAIAGRFAAEVAGGQSTEQASARATKELDRVARHLSRVTTLVTTVADVSAFSPGSSVADQRLTRYGIGVAQGDHEVMGEGAIFIVVLLGET